MIEFLGYNNCNWERDEILSLGEILPDGNEDRIYDLKTILFSG